MKTLYLDIFSGISGDMFIGALLDLGVEARQLEAELAKLGLAGYRLEVCRQERGRIAGTQFSVRLETAPGPGVGEEPGFPHAHEHPHADGTSHAHEHHHHAEADHHEHQVVQHEHVHWPGSEGGQTGHGAKGGRAGERNFAEISRLISSSALSAPVKHKALAVFRRLAVAEGKIHGVAAEAVHFHEVGAMDSIVDIVGACLGLELLGWPRVLASPVVEGTGWVHCAHGRFPLPAPATLEILGARGVSLTQCAEPHEMVTPTGAALLAELVEDFGSMQGLVATRIGYGLGGREHSTRPNVLRAALGETVAETASAAEVAAADAVGLDWERDLVTVLETNLDDSPAEVLGHFLELALAAGALEVFYTAIQMKKNRPGVLLTVLCPAAEADKFSELILRETSAFGVRRYAAERRKLRRSFITVKTRYGEVTVKLGRLGGRIVQAAPEFESCKSLAARTGIPLRQIYEAALAAATPD